MVSSTFIDLKGHRVAAFDALLANNLFPVGMEANIGAPDDHVISSSLDMVASAAAYICLIGDRYGQTPASATDNPNGLSVTELEFDKAVALGLPIRLLVMGDNHPIPKGAIERDPAKQQKLATFIAKAKRLRPDEDLHRIYQTFDSLEDLRVAIQRAAVSLRDHLSQLPTSKASTTPDPAPPDPMPAAPAPDQPNLSIPAPRHTAGRAAALLAFGALVPAATGLADQAIAHLFSVDLRTNSALRALVFYLFPCLVILAQFAVEWRSRVVRRRQQGLAIAPAAVPTGYFRIGPYGNTPEDTAAFHRADRAHIRVLNWLNRVEGAPLYLTGQSGCGKSSLLQAFVLPALRASAATVIECRAWTDPLAALITALATIPGPARRRPAAALPPRAALEAATRRADNGLVVVFDQFEEFAILGTPEAHAAFAAFIADLGTRPLPGLRLLLSFRSDYKAALDAFNLPPMHDGQNWQEIGAFTPRDAAIFLAESKLGLSRSAIDSLLASAARLDDLAGLVRPVTLNFIGHVLSSERTHAPSLEAEVLVAAYLGRILSAPELRDQAPDLLPHLLTAQATKRPRSEADLCQASGLARGHVRTVLNALAQAGLARPLEGAMRIWELSHDFVAKVLSQHLGMSRRRFLQRAAANAAPTLVAVSMSAAAAAIVLEHTADERARSRLAELGFAISPLYNGTSLLHITVTPALTLRSPDLAIPLLRRFVAQIGSFAGVGSRINDLAPVAGLTNLRNLDLDGTLVHDLRPIAGLANLESLKLWRTRVDDLAPIERLANLKFLGLQATMVHDLAPIAGLTNLEDLNISGTRVTDLTAIAKLPKLRSLNITGLRPGIEDAIPRRAEINITRYR